MAQRQRFWSRRRGSKITSPDGLQVTSFPPGYIEALSLYGLRGSYGYLYRSQPNVRTVVDFFASEVSSIKLKHYEKVPTSVGLPSGRMELEDSELTKLLNNPSPGVTRSRLWLATALDKCIYDVAYWRKIYQSGVVRAIVRIPPAALVPQRNPVTQQITHYTTLMNARVELSELVIFHGYDPELQDGQVSPMETIRRVLAEEYAAGRNREYTWRNAARKSGVVLRPTDAPEWSQQQREAWRSDFEGVMTGDTNAGKVGLLEDGMTWKEATWSPEEMEYLGARAMTRKECAANWRIDPRLVFASDEPVTPECRTAFYVDRLVPSLTGFSEEIDIQLLPEFNRFDSERRQYTQFNVDAKLKGSFEEQAKILVMTTGRPIISVDEARARLDLPKAPDGQGEGLTIPGNVSVGGQASPFSPHEVPGGLPGMGQTPGSGVVPRAAALRGALSKALQAHLERQGKTVMNFYHQTASKGIVRLEDVWRHPERWDKELAEDLTEMGANGQARKWAEKVNAQTREMLGPLISADYLLVFSPDRAEELAYELLEEES